MRVAVISDLHLGPRPGRDAFGHDARAFDRWLSTLLDTHDHLVLNGDIFQTDHELGVGADVAAGALQAALRRAPRLAARLRDPRVHYLHGNHDHAAQALLDAETELKLTHGSAAVYITHGDRFDPVLARAPRISQAATWVTGRVRSARLGPLASWLEERDVDIKARRFQRPNGPYAAAAGLLAREQRADVVVFGHTHVPCSHELPHCWWANPGSCSLGRRALVSVDLAAGTVVVRQE